MPGRRKNERMICMLLEDIGSDFSKELVKSVANAIPAGRGIKLIVLPGKYDDGKGSDSIHDYKAVYNSVFRLSSLCDVDGFIIHLGSVNERDVNNEQIYSSVMDKHREVPKVLVASDLEDVVTVNYDNETGIREAVEYLVNADGLTKFCMLGGRDDNKDARVRREMFEKCLAEYGITLKEKNFVNTDMTAKCVNEAGRLLDDNPDVQAVFCVNDAAGQGLYEAMARRGLKAGRDIMVFGFDNTRMSGELIPPMTSIGSDEMSLGQKALELLLAMMNGDSAKSATVPTRLYGRESFPYEMYDYNRMELVNADPAFIYRMFDDCFYRYKSSFIDREQVNLRRLFYEIFYSILIAMKRRYMSIETFDELAKMVDKFFEKGAMEYTDALKLTKSIERIQVGINHVQRSLAATVLVNRLFSRMKDRAIMAQSMHMISRENNYASEMLKMESFMIGSASGNCREENIYRNFGQLGLDNSALYVFDEAVDYSGGSSTVFPEIIRLKCVMRSGELYLLSEERQHCRVSDVLERDELSSRCRGFVAFPIFCRKLIYGLLMCELTDNIYERGEFIAMQLGRAFALCSREK
ncbi:LacI family DNA-binding transcriptional regulator [uncultured Ruminococcus sp.]|uniref:LacI family DNA-binding transcriptional regulator n=1 Tax=uncultured Ruminococcus sp. TaxID=165186 RepID=UPI0025CEF705|nr:LacI family DNA-binding transcriptional regulator [uncultured Ruminococcus sp.]